MSGCDRARSAAAALVLGDLAGDERAAILDHLEGCPACRAVVADTGAALEALLVAAPSVDPPGGFEGRVLARIDEQARRRATDRPEVAPVTPRLPGDGVPGDGDGDGVGGSVGAVTGARGVRAGSTLDGRSRAPLDEVARARRRRRRWTVALVAAGAAAVILIVGLALRGPSGGTSVAASVRSAPMVAADGYRVGRSVLSADPDTLVVAVPGWQAPGAPVTSYRVELGTHDGQVRSLSGVRLRDGRWTGELPVEPEAVRWVALVTPAGDEVCRARFGPT